MFDLFFRTKEVSCKIFLSMFFPNVKQQFVYVEREDILMIDEFDWLVFVFSPYHNATETNTIYHCPIPIFEKWVWDLNLIRTLKKKIHVNYISEGKKNHESCEKNELTIIKETIQLEIIVPVWQANIRFVVNHQPKGNVLLTLRLSWPKTFYSLKA